MGRVEAGPINGDNDARVKPLPQRQGRICGQGDSGIGGRRRGFGWVDR